MRGDYFVSRLLQFLLMAFLLAACGKAKKEDKSLPGIADDPDLRAPASQEKPVLSPEEMEEGKALYTTHCLVCHQVTGGGVPGLNPPLKGTEYVLGDKTRLVRILLNGSNEGLQIEGVSYSNAMPGFSILTDLQLARLATYIRNNFGNTASPVTMDEVAAVRDVE